MSDLILHNGFLLTQDPANPQAEAIAIQKGKIQALGTWDEIQNLRRSHTRQIDLGGRTLIPAFNDAHVHIWKVGHLLTSMLDVRGVASIPDLQLRIRDFAASLPPEEWFMGRGYNEAAMDEKRHPTKADLDAILPDRPAYLIRTCAHIVVVNSKALELAGITAQTAAPAGGVIELGADGQPNGILHETALGLVFRHIPDPSDYEKMLLAAARHQLELGIASATDPGVMPNLLEVYRRLDAEQKLLNRVNVMAIRRPDGGSETLPLPARHESDFLRIDTVKFFADGGLSGATAAISQPYPHNGRYGVKRFEFEELFQLAKDAHLGGLRIGIHAIGDVAIETVLQVYEALYQLGAGPRHRIEHLGLPTPDHLARAARMGIIAVPQSIFLDVLGGNFLQYVPPAMLPQCYPLRAMLDAGLTLALSSDAPVVKEDNPLRGMQAAILRRTSDQRFISPEQAISAAEALYAYTMGGAIASGDAANRGSLSVGKWADLAILSGNPLSVDPEALTEIQVQMTLVGGEIRFEK